MVVIASTWKVKVPVMHAVTTMLRQPARRMSRSERQPNTAASRIGNASMCPIERQNTMSQALAGMLRITAPPTLQHSGAATAQARPIILGGRAMAGGW